jgi:hypothetical protein
MEWLGKYQIDDTKIPVIIARDRLLNSADKQTPFLSLERRACKIIQVNGAIRNKTNAHFISRPAPIERPNNMENFLFEKFSVQIKR